MHVYNTGLFSDFCSAAADRIKQQAPPIIKQAPVNIIGVTTTSPKEKCKKKIYIYKFQVHNSNLFFYLSVFSPPIPFLSLPSVPLTVEQRSLSTLSKLVSFVLLWPLVVSVNCFSLQAIAVILFKSPLLFSLVFKRKVSCKHSQGWWRHTNTNIPLIGTVVCAPFVVGTRVVDHRASSFFQIFNWRRRRYTIWCLHVCYLSFHYFNTIIPYGRFVFQPASWMPSRSLTSLANFYICRCISKKNNRYITTEQHEGPSYFMTIFLCLHDFIAVAHKVFVFWQKLKRQRNFCLLNFLNRLRVPAAGAAAYHSALR